MNDIDLQLHYARMDRLFRRSPRQPRQGLFLHTEYGILTLMARDVSHDPVWLEVSGDLEYEKRYCDLMYFDLEDPE